ncbi:hypothetical protein [Bradyrhizobium genosp. P]|uniref:hypothetical protein n=1 Tax=Bradyrhizobium genosp. P TaxID=83641 RepID=UPI003CF83625
MKKLKENNDKPLTYSVPEAGRMACLGRNGAYAAAERGEIPTVSFGRLLRVPAAAWEKILREGRPPPKSSSDPPCR